MFPYKIGTANILFKQINLSTTHLVRRKIEINRVKQNSTYLYKNDEISCNLKLVYLNILFLL